MVEKMKKNKLLILMVATVVCFTMWRIFSTKSKLPNFLPHAIDRFIVRPSDYDAQIRNLPNLSQINWPPLQLSAHPYGRPDEQGHTRKPPMPFEPVMSAGQRNLMQRLLRVFCRGMFENGLGDRFLLHAGTMIGSYRHHDFIPWDDDVDLLVDNTIRPQVQRILRGLAPDYILTVHGGKDKFHTPIERNATVLLGDPELSQPIGHYPFGWPYLDIHYYSSNGSHISEMVASFGLKKVFPVNVVFPLQFRPIREDWFPTPHDPMLFIHWGYGNTSECATQGYSHALERNTNSQKRLCSKLARRYAFIRRSPGIASFEAEGNAITLKGEQRQEWALVLEELVIPSTSGQVSVIHQLELPAPWHNTLAETYGFGYRQPIP